MNINRIFLPILIFFILIVMGACSSTPEIEGFDNNHWQNDSHGCDGVRLKQAEILINHRDELIGENQREITNLLGKPNRHELYSRSKKAFIYFLSNGPGCEQELENPDKLVIRFDALGRVKEVVLYKK
ncbi:MAG: hypothetical protein ABFS32_12035 [Bacteroidota bacterium]